MPSLNNPIALKRQRSGASALAAALLLGVAFAAPATAQEAAPAAAEAAPAPQASRNLNEGVAAIVNDEIISTYDLRQRILLLILTSGVQPTQESLPQLQQQALRSLIEERLELQEVRKQEKKQKFDIVPKDAEIEQQIAVLAQDNRISAEQLKGSLAAAGVDIGTLKDQLRAQISWQRWISGRYGSRVRIGDSQVKAQMKRLAAEASKPRYLIGEVYIEATRAGGQAEAMKGAEQLIAQIQQGAPFAGVARQFSSAPTAANGGDAGWVLASEKPPEVAAALEQMHNGQLSGPIPVQDGVYIVYLREKQSGADATLITLKQAAVRLAGDATPEQVADAAKTLEQVRAKAPSCADLQAAAAGVPGVTVSDLGEADINELSEAFRTAAQSLPDNQLSQPIRTPVGLHLIEVCGRRQSGAKAISAQEVENRLYAQQLAMLSKRYLRDLRNSATIETR
jgi:peptidyl-prolyl cis-trans isomerase SurA